MSLKWFAMLDRSNTELKQASGRLPQAASEAGLKVKKILAKNLMIKHSYTFNTILQTFADHDRDTLQI